MIAIRINVYRGVWTVVDDVGRQFESHSLRQPSLAFGELRLDQAFGLATSASDRQAKDVSTNGDSFDHVVVASCDRCGPAERKTFRLHRPQRSRHSSLHIGV